MTDGEQRPEPASLHLEIPIEPLPTAPLVPRPAPPDPEPPPAVLSGGIARPEVDPTGQNVVAEPDARPEPDVAPEPEAVREDGGRGALRPATPRPAPTRPAGCPRPERPPRFTDARHPFRAAIGLIFLVILGSLALAAAIGAAVVVIAFAVRQTVG